MAKKATLIDLAEISKSLMNAGRKVEGVKEWGSFMALIIFETKEAVEDAISNGAEWLTSSLFYQIRPWSMKEWSQSRKVWIECYGL